MQNCLTAYPSYTFIAHEYTELKSFILVLFKYKKLAILKLLHARQANHANKLQDSLIVV